MGTCPHLSAIAHQQWYTTATHSQPDIRCLPEHPLVTALRINPRSAHSKISPESPGERGGGAGVDAVTTLRNESGASAIWILGVVRQVPCQNRNPLHPTSAIRIAIGRDRWDSCLLAVLSFSVHQSNMNTKRPPAVQPVVLRVIWPRGLLCLQSSRTP